MSTTVLDDDPLLTLDEIAAHQRTTKRALYQRRQRGTAPPFERSGGRLLIRQSVYLAWLDAQCARAQA